MARPLNEQVIKERIKINILLMKTNKKIVTDMMSKMMKCDPQCSSRETREALSKFIKASEAICTDTFKLKLIKGK